MKAEMARFVVPCFVVLFCCYGCIFGSPVSRGEAGLMSQYEIVGISTPTEQHYLHSMISELLTKVVIDPFKEFVTMTALYLEIFGVASGSHVIVFPSDGLSPEEVKELQVVAIASSNIWLKLPHAEEINGIYINSSKSIIPNIFNSSSLKSVATNLKELFKKIDQAILDNDTLAPIYREEKAKIEKLELLPLVNGTGNPDTVYKTYPRFRNFIIRRQLLEHLSGDDLMINNYNYTQFQRYALSQAVMKIAKTDKSSKMQEVFDQVVDITMDKLDPSTKTADPSTVIDELLFSTLEEKFKTIPELKDEFAAIVDDLIKKRKV